MSLGWIEFVVFTVFYNADITTLVNEENLWGRHFKGADRIHPVGPSLIVSFKPNGPIHQPFLKTLLLTPKT